MMSDEEYIRNTLSEAEVLGRMGNAAWALALAADEYQMALRGEQPPGKPKLTEDDVQAMQDAFEEAYVEVINCAGALGTNEYWEWRIHELLPAIRKRWREELEEKYGDEYHEVDQNK